MTREPLRPNALRLCVWGEVQRSCNILRRIGSAPPRLIAPCPAAAAPSGSRRDTPGCVYSLAAAKQRDTPGCVYTLDQMGAPGRDTLPFLFFFYLL